MDLGLQLLNLYWDCIRLVWFNYILSSNLVVFRFGINPHPKHSLKPQTSAEGKPLLAANKADKTISEHKTPLSISNAIIIKSIQQ